eukprot:3829483-Amphidinium_carterae.1
MKVVTFGALEVHNPGPCFHLYGFAVYFHAGQGQKAWTSMRFIIIELRWSCGKSRPAFVELTLTAIVRGFTEYVYRRNSLKEHNTPQ